MLSHFIRRLDILAPDVVRKWRLEYVRLAANPAQERSRVKQCNVPMPDGSSQSFTPSIRLTSKRSASLGAGHCLCRVGDLETAMLSGPRQAFCKPAILHWEDRATEWSGRPDRVSISLQLSGERGGLLDVTTIDAKSSYWTLGGDHPQGLLRQPLETYARRLAGE